MLSAVRWRFRICNYLFRLAIAWFGLATICHLSLPFDRALLDEIAFASEVIAAGIFSTAFALTLAIYRCPVCDKYLSRFRPRKEYCAGCGAKVRAEKD